MKTIVSSRPTILLSTVACALLCGTVHAGWQKDMVLGTGGGSSGGGGSAPVYYNPGPTAEQIAAQQAAQAAAQREAERVAAQQVRMNAANTRNDQGLASYKKGNWAAAVACFEQALQNSPGDRVILSNLQIAREQLDSQRREEQRKTVDTSAAADMKSAVNRITDSIADTKPASTSGPGTGGGLTFISADADAGGPVTNDAFGTKKANPDLKAGDPDAGRIGTDTNAGNQLAAIEHNDKPFGSVQPKAGGSQENAGAVSGLGFDTGVKKAGSISDVKVEAAPGAMVMPEITPAMSKDPIVQQDMKNFKEWAPQLQKAKEELKQAQAAVQNAKNPAAAAAANTALMAAKTKHDGLDIAVQSAKAEIADRKIYIEKLAVSTATTAAATPAGN